jgi:hypothetical protein
MTVVFTLVKFLNDYCSRLRHRVRSVGMQDCRERQLELYENQQVSSHRPNDLQQDGPLNRRVNIIAPLTTLVELPVLYAL